MTNCKAFFRTPESASRTSSLTFMLLATSMISACTSSAAVQVPAAETLQVSGRVISVDASPMAYDGDGLMVLTTDTQGRVTVHVPARSNLCKAQGLDVFHRATAGMRIEAVGTRTGPSDMTVCIEEIHRLKIVE